MLSDDKAVILVDFFIQIIISFYLLDFVIDWFNFIANSHFITVFFLNLNGLFDW